IGLAHGVEIASHEPSNSSSPATPQTPWTSVAVSCLAAWKEAGGGVPSTFLKLAAGVMTEVSGPSGSLPRFGLANLGGSILVALPLLGIQSLVSRSPSARALVISYVCKRLRGVRVPSWC